MITKRAMSKQLVEIGDYVYVCPVPFATDVIVKEGEGIVIIKNAVLFNNGKRTDLFLTEEDELYYYSESGKKRNLKAETAMSLLLDVSDDFRNVEVSDRDVQTILYHFIKDNDLLPAPFVTEVAATTN